MKSTKEYLTTAHDHDLKWQKELTFYKDEIIIFRKRLAEVSAKNTAKEIKMMVSHFENQFIINKELIDELNHEINVLEDTLAREIKNNPVAYDHKTIHKSELNGKMIMFEKLFTQLRKSFGKFLSEVM